MSQQLSHNAQAFDLNQSFDPGSYFLGLVQQAARSTVPVQISSEAMGEVLIDPVKQRYAAYVSDLKLFCCMPVRTLRMTPCHDCAIRAHDVARDLDELLWVAAYYASGGRLLVDTSKFDVLELNYWHNLSRLPATPNMMLLCALFGRRSHSISLARKRLGVSEEEAYRFYSAALASGALRRVSTPTAAFKEEEPPEPMTLSKTLSHLWHRLVG